MADEQVAIEHTAHAPVDPKPVTISDEDFDEILGPKTPGEDQPETENEAAETKETKQPDGEPETKEKAGEEEGAQTKTNEQPDGELEGEEKAHDPAKGLDKTLQRFQQSMTTMQQQFSDMLESAEARIEQAVKGAEPKVDLVAEAIKQAEADGDELDDVAKAVIKNTVGPMQELLDKQQLQIDELKAAKPQPQTPQAQQSQRESDAKAWIGSELGVTDDEQAETIFALATTAYNEAVIEAGGEKALNEAYGPKGYQVFAEKLLRDAAGIVAKNTSNNTNNPATQKDTSASTDGTQITATGNTGTDLKTDTLPPATSSEEVLERFEAEGGVINLHDE